MLVCIELYSTFIELYRGEKNPLWLPQGVFSYTLLIGKKNLMCVFVPNQSGYT